MAQEYIILRDDIVRNKQLSPMVLPTYFYLQASRGLNGRVLTSLELLLSYCGYTYNRRSKELGHIDEMISTLKYLKEQHYIEKFYEKDSFTEIEDVKDIKPTKVFYIEVNPEIMNFMGDGFLKAPASDWIRLLECYRNEKNVKLWKLITVYCFIVRNIFRSRLDFKDGMENYHDNVEIAEKKPNYLRTTLDWISEQLASGYSRKTVYMLLNALINSGIIHSKAVGCVEDQYGNKLKVGTVYVMDSEFWEVELDSAAKIEFAKRQVYYKKGEK